MVSILMHIKDLLSDKKFEKSNKKFNHLWQVQADEVSAYFGQKLYWLFYKYYDFEIMDGYRVCKEKGITAVPYLLGILNDFKKKRQAASGEEGGQSGVRHLSVQG